MSKQRGPIALYGATGYTGRLVAHELATAGAEFVLSGRSRPKLEALAEEVGKVAGVQPAALDDPAALRSLMADCSAVITCAGPFAHCGEPVLKAAIETGTHYLDTTGEQPYMDMIFRRYGADAERKRVAAIPAMGFDYVPGDMIASLTADGMGPLREISLAYGGRGFVPTRGTTLSTLEIMKGGALEYRDGAWRPSHGGFGRGSFDFGPEEGRQRMIRYPAGEQITVPRHVATQNVKTTISTSLMASGPAATLLPLLARPFGIALRTPIKRALELAVSKLPEGPSEEERRAVRFTIVCDAHSAEASRRGVVSGSDVYGLTAASVARGAILAASKGFRGRGALAPAQAFDPRDFLAALERFDVRWDVESPREPSREPVKATA